tara:strand:- start:794 stop:1063 length:270 start_codon:yes stop_codon:yes gene_type:complete
MSKLADEDSNKSRTAEITLISRPEQTFKTRVPDDDLPPLEEGGTQHSNSSKMYAISAGMLNCMNQSMCIQGCTYLNALNTYLKLSFIRA